MNKPFSELTIKDVITLCRKQLSCEDCPICSQCATLFKDNPESWSYFNKDDMEKEIYL